MTDESAPKKKTEGVKVKTKDGVKIETKKGVRIKTQKRVKTAVKKDVNTDVKKQVVPDSMKLSPTEAKGDAPVVGKEDHALQSKGDGSTEEPKKEAAAVEPKADVPVESTEDVAESEADESEESTVEVATESKEDDAAEKTVEVNTERDEDIPVETEKEPENDIPKVEKSSKITAGKIVVGVVVLLILIVAVVYNIPQTPSPKTNKTVKIHISQEETKPQEVPPAADMPTELTATTSQEAPSEEIPVASVAETDSVPADQPPTSIASKKTIAPEQTADKSEGLLPAKPPQLSATDKAEPESDRSQVGSVQTLELINIDLQEAGSGSDIHIQANGPIKQYNFFMLTNPPRLVIDLKGRWEKPKFYNVNLTHELIELVRLWKYEEKLRIVCDLKIDPKSKPVIETVADGLIVKFEKTAPPT